MLARIHIGHVVTFIVVNLAATTVSLGRAVPEIDGSPKDQGRLSAQIGKCQEIPLRRIYIIINALYAASCTIFFRRRLYG